MMSAFFSKNVERFKNCDKCLGPLVNLDISITALVLAIASPLAFKYTYIGNFYFLMKNFVTDSLFKKGDLN